MLLLEQIQLGKNLLKNRMVMSAMTRNRADPNGIVGTSTVTYYTQRASAGLIISEATNISLQGTGSISTPGIYTRPQIEAWKKVTKSVHDQGGVIFLELWHTGRVGHSIDRNGVLPVAPSAIGIKEKKHFISNGLMDYEVPRSLTLSEIREIISDYVTAAKNAIEAGFDGVELHASNGYLPNQFLAESANQRSDEYGGSIENNCRFTLRIMRELIDEIGGDRVGIKISPFLTNSGTTCKDPVKTFTYLINSLNKMKILFIELTRKYPIDDINEIFPDTDEIEFFGKRTNHFLIANAGYSKETAEAALERGRVNLISFASLFLANPDLPRRFELNLPLNMPDKTTYYTGGGRGYIDYPTHKTNL